MQLLLEKRQMNKEIIIGYLDQKEQMSVNPLALDDAAIHAAELLYSYYINKPFWDITSFAMNMPTYKVL